MKIALVCLDSLPCPPIKSGAIEVLIARAAPYLVRLNNDVTVFSIRNPSLADRETRDGVKYIRYPKKNYLPRVLDALKTGNFNIIQVYNKPQWLRDIRIASPSSRLVLSLHNLFLENEIDAEHTGQYADHIVTVSQFVAKYAAKQVPAASNKITALYTGEDPHRFIRHDSEKGRKTAAKLKRKLGVPNHYRVILFVGRLVPSKGCHHVVDAMKIVKKLRPKTALVIVGSRSFGKLDDNEYVLSLKKKARRISKDIRFTNFIPVDGISRFYTMSDVFVCSSQWEEPLARVHYEAMAAALPMITTRRGGNPEIVDHGRNGFVIDRYEDPKAFAESIIRLLDNAKLRARMGRLNRNLVKKTYNFKSYASRIMNLYRQLVKKS